MKAKMSDKIHNCPKCGEWWSEAAASECPRCLAAKPCSTFDEWWNRVGQYYDPDTSDVPWEDKRRFLAELAFDAAMAQSRNYTADRAVDPLTVTFSNGRTVSKGSTSLMIGMNSNKP